MCCYTDKLGQIYNYVCKNLVLTSDIQLHIFRWYFGKMFIRLFYSLVPEVDIIQHSQTHLLVT